MNNLYNWGLSDRYEQEAHLYEPLHPARIIGQHRNLYTIVTENGQMQATVSGKFIHGAVSSADFPAVGDWVMIKTDSNACWSESETAVIHQVLTRKTVFGRKAAGTSYEQQIIAANIDTVFICMALNEDYNLRRLERYLAVAWDSRAVPVIILTKADLCGNLEKQITEAQKISLDAEIIICSGLRENGYDTVTPHIRPGVTVAFIGSSGVGKSTLINHFIGNNMLTTNEISENGRGRHTTTHRQLILLPNGGLVIDTPGMRELGVLNADIGKTFSDIEELAEACRFKDCSHTAEPGCAVLAAIEAETLDKARFQNYKKLQAETEYNGLTSRQKEEAKIKRMFGSKNSMKQIFRQIKKKNS